MNDGDNNGDKLLASVLRTLGDDGLAAVAANHDAAVAAEYARRLRDRTQAAITARKEARALRKTLMSLAITAYGQAAGYSQGEILSSVSDPRDREQVFWLTNQRIKQLLEHEQAARWSDAAGFVVLWILGILLFAASQPLQDRPFGTWSDWLVAGLVAFIGAAILRATTVAVSERMRRKSRRLLTATQSSRSGTSESTHPTSYTPRAVRHDGGSGGTP